MNYATSDGDAVKGADYEETNGTVRFEVRETQKIIRVPIRDDEHDDSGETMTLTLSSPNPSAHVRIADASATGTITISAPLPRALMARFGRTVAVHVVEHVEERIAAPRPPGFRGRFAGQELRRGMERDFALSFLSQFGGSAGANPLGSGVHDPMAGSPAAGAGSLGTPGLAGGGAGMASAGGLIGAMAGSDDGPNGRGLDEMGLGGGDVLTGSAFSLNRETRQGGILSFWSRGAQSHFAGAGGVGRTPCPAPPGPRRLPNERPGQRRFRPVGRRAGEASVARSTRAGEGDAPARAATAPSDPPASGAADA